MIGKPRTAMPVRSCSVASAKGSKHSFHPQSRCSRVPRFGGAAGYLLEPFSTDRQELVAPLVDQTRAHPTAPRRLNAAHRPGQYRQPQPGLLFSRDLRQSRPDELSGDLSGVPPPNELGDPAKAVESADDMAVQPMVEHVPTRPGRR